MLSTFRRHRLALCAAAAAAIALGLPAGAAAPKPGLHISDPVGDANGINDQGTGLPVPSASTSPASLSGADITSIDLRTEFVGKGKRRTTSGFDVTLKLNAPLQKGVLITVTMNSSASCGGSNVIQLGYGTSSLAVCQGPSGSTTETKVGSYAASADGKSVTWFIGPIFKPGTKITNVAASTSVFVLGVFDEAASNGIFTYGK